MIKNLARRAIECGLDRRNGHLQQFDQGVGGYAIQQDPHELARLVCLLAAHSPFRWSLDIGVASGGTARFIREHVEIVRMRFIDDGQHPDRVLWQSHRTEIANLCQSVGGDVAEVETRSDSLEASEFLVKTVGPFGLVSIDGGHTAEAVRNDWELVRPYLAAQSLVWFHDIYENGGPSLVWGELKRRYTVLLETRGPFGIGVLRYGDP